MKLQVHVRYKDYCIALETTKLERRKDILNIKSIKNYHIKY